jgi:hypothetical protein
MRVTRYFFLIIAIGSFYNVINALFFLDESVGYRVFGTVETNKTVFVLIYLIFAVVCLASFLRHSHKKAGE